MTITTLAEFNAANTAHDQEMKRKLSHVMKNWDNFHPELQRYAMGLLGETEWFKPELASISEMKALHVFNLIKMWKEKNSGFPKQGYIIQGINVGRSLYDARLGNNQNLEGLLNSEYGDDWKENVATNERVNANEIFDLIVKWKRQNQGFPPNVCKVDNIPVGRLIQSARKGKNKALIALLNAKYGNAWKEQRSRKLFTPSEQTLQLIIEWKKNNAGFPAQLCTFKGVNIGRTLMHARQGRTHKILAKLLDSKYGDEWRQTGRSPRKKKV